METVDASNQPLDNGTGICSSSGPSFARWLQAPLLITGSGDCHAPPDPIQASSPSQGYATHPPREPDPSGPGSGLVMTLLPAEDTGTGCYSNRAASPVTYSHWRHMHCRIQPGLSQVAVLPSLCPTGSSTVAPPGAGEDGAEPERVPWVCLRHQMLVAFSVWGWTGDSWTWVVALTGLKHETSPETVTGKLQELKEDIPTTRRQQQMLAGGFAAQQEGRESEGGLGRTSHSFHLSHSSC